MGRPVVIIDLEDKIVGIINTMYEELHKPDGDFSVVECGLEDIESLREKVKAIEYLLLTDKVDNLTKELKQLKETQ